MTTQAPVLARRYELGRLLGQGGMARVHRGTDRVLGRTVAVKVLAAPYDRDEGFVARFRQEALSAASLNHPNIVSIFDTGSDGDTHFIVMECVEGRTLAEVIRAEAPMPPERVTAIGRAICDALSAAHAAGIVHRDVKPGNVMITDGGEVKVMDFGIARAADTESVTRSGIVLGTAAYLSPEQARGEPADARSDLYALGCVLYEMLTGRPPFEGETPMATLYRHVHDEPEPPSNLARVPPALEGVVLRLLAKDPAQRPQRAEEVAETLAASIQASTLPLDTADTAVLRPSEDATAPLLWTEQDELERTRLLDRLREDEPTSRRAILTAAVAALALLLGSMLLSSLLGRDGPTSAAARKDARRQTTASPTMQAPTDVSSAYVALVQAIVEGQDAGEIEEGAARDLLNRAQEVLDKYREGDGEEVAKKSEEFLAKLDEFVGKGEVTPGRADAIHLAFDEMIELMQAELPAEEGGDEGGSEPGPPPHAQGNGKGQGKGDDD